MSIINQLRTIAMQSLSPCVEISLCGRLNKIFKHFQKWQKPRKLFFIENIVVRSKKFGQLSFCLVSKSFKNKKIKDSIWDKVKKKAKTASILWIPVFLNSQTLAYFLGRFQKLSVLQKIVVVWILDKEKYVTVCLQK